MQEASRISTPRHEECRTMLLKEHQKVLSRAVPIKAWMKQLLPHEQQLFTDGKLDNITHKGSTSVWLQSIGTVPNPGFTTVYRPMGDKEATYLVQNGLLPDTQPYQAIIEGPVGFWYANKFLTGQKWTDTHPSTIAEFVVPNALVATLEKIQCKIEDGAISMGLGNKAGGGLELFNASLREGVSSWRIVKVKRTLK